MLSINYYGKTVMAGKKEEGFGPVHNALLLRLHGEVCSPVLVTEEESDFVWEIMQTLVSLPSTENVYVAGSGITRVLLLACQGVTL